jgi:hypothetical protein
MRHVSYSACNLQEHLFMSLALDPSFNHMPAKIGKASNCLSRERRRQREGEERRRPLSGLVNGGGGGGGVCGPKKKKK